MLSVPMTVQRFVMAKPQRFLIRMCQHASAFKESSNLQTSSDKFLNSIQAIKDPTAMVALLQCNKNSLTEKHVLAAVRFMATIYEKKHYSSTDPDEEVLLQLFRLIQTSIACLETESKNLEIQKDYLKITKNRVQNISVKKDFSNQQESLRKAFGYSKENRFHAILEEFNNDQKGCQDILLKLKEELGRLEYKLSIEEATSIFESLCSKYTYSRIGTEILRSIYGVFIDNWRLLTNEQVTRMAMEISRKVVKGRMEEFYDPKLLEAFSDKILERKVFYDAISYLKTLKALKHCDLRILKFVCEEFLCQVSDNVLSPPKKIFSFVAIIQAQAVFKYKSPICQDIVEQIDPDELTANLTLENLCTMSLHLACIDIYNNQMLEKLFSGGNFFLGNPYIHWSFCQLYQRLATLSNYKGPMPTNEQLSTLANLHIRKEMKQYSLLYVLKSIYGSSRIKGTIKTNLLTRLHHEIDHAVCVHVDKHTPTSIDFNGTDSNAWNVGPDFVENIIIPQNHKLLLFLNLVKNRLIRNTQKREGLCELSIQTLKSMSPKWVVIPVCEENWGGMLLQEKAATLKAIINSELARNPV